MSGPAGRGEGLPPHAGEAPPPPLIQVQATLLQGNHDHDLSYSIKKNITDTEKQRKSVLWIRNDLFWILIRI